MDFRGKCFVIMGATSDLGQAICKQLSTSGASLFMAGRNAERLEDLRSNLPRPESHAYVKSEITEDSFYAIQDDLVNFIDKNSMAGINGGVYCPGIVDALPVRAFDWKIINNIVNVNFVGAMMFVKLLTSAKVRNKLCESIVLISSVRSKRGAKALSIYSGTKAGLAGACRSMAIELAPLNIRINCIAPGSMGTRMNEKVMEISKQYLTDMMSKHPLGLGTAQDVSNAVAFLLSDESRWITGTELIVDGGFLA